MAAAIIADVVIVGPLVLAAGLLTGRRLFIAPEARNFAVLLTLSFIVSLLFEWLRRAGGRCLQASAGDGNQCRCLHGKFGPLVLGLAATLSLLLVQRHVLAPIIYLALGGLCPAVIWNY